MLAAAYWDIESVSSHNAGTCPHSNIRWGRYYILWHVGMFKWWWNTVWKKGMIELGRFEVFLVVVLKIKVLGMWCYIIGPVFCDVLKKCTVFIFRFLQYKYSHLGGKKQVPPTTSSDWLATVSSHPVSAAITYMTPSLVSCSSVLLQLLYPEDEGTAVLQNVMNCLPVDTMSHPSRPEPLLI